MGRVLDLTASMARVVACDVRTFSRPAKFLSVVAYRDSDFV